MKDEWVQPYVENVGEEVRLPGSNSCSKSPIVALRFAFPQKPKEGHTPTLFVIAFKNYDFISAMTMNNEAYSAYPSEAEVLLCEGCPVYVLAVDRGIMIENQTGGDMASFTGRAITIVHLFH